MVFLHFSEKHPIITITWRCILKQRNILFTIWKFLFCICIVIMHCHIPFNNSSFFDGAYIFVDFFFIFQGYYMYEKINSIKNPFDEAFLYVQKRICRFFPCTLFLVVLLLLLNVSTHCISDFFTTTLEIFTKLSFTGMIIPGLLEYTSYLWFLSASIFAGAFCMFLLCTLKQKLIIFLPIAVCFINNYLIHAYGHMDIWGEQLLAGLVYSGMLRAVSGILLGLLCKAVRSKITILHKPQKTIALFISILLSLFCIVGSIFYVRTQYDLVTTIRFFRYTVKPSVACLTM